jgi:hypothetical protein
MPASAETAHLADDRFHTRNAADGAIGMATLGALAANGAVELAAEERSVANPIVLAAACRG